MRSLMLLLSAAAAVGTTVPVSTSPSPCSVCDLFVGYGYTCTDIQSWGFDCSGCLGCSLGQLPVSTSQPPSACDVCDLYTGYGYTCDTIETWGYSCAGCASCSATNNVTSPVSTDCAVCDLYVTYGFSCSAITTWGYDCSMCTSCVSTTTTTWHATTTSTTSTSTIANMDPTLVCSHCHMSPNGIFAATAHGACVPSHKNMSVCVDLTQHYLCSATSDVHTPGCMAIHEGMVKISGTDNTNSGLLMVYHNNEWGTVCNVDFHFVDAHVACQQLGFLAAAWYGKLPISSAGMPIWMSHVDCQGSEASVMDCAHNGFGFNNCGHNQDVSLICMPHPCTLR